MTVQTEQAQQLVEETGHIADASVALVGVTDEGLKGAAAGLAAVAEATEAGHEMVAGELAANRALTAGLADAIGNAVGQAFGPLLAPFSGLQGVQGVPGDKGDRGETGPTGATGKQGVVGPVGGKGDKGERGERGLQGVPGAKGDRGAKGSKGDTGSAGPIGPAGKDGEPGLGGGSGGGGMVGIQVMDDGEVLASQAMTFDFSTGLAVEMVNNKAVVTATGGGGGSDDQTAAEVPFTPAGTISATNVQAAIEEVAAEATGAQDIEEVLTQGDDAGGQEVTNLGRAEIVGTDANTTDPLLLVKGAADFENHQAKAIQVQLADGTVVHNLLAYGFYKLTAPAGQGYPRLDLESVDYPTLVAQIGNNGLILGIEKNTSGGYIQVYDTGGTDAIDYFIVDPGGFARILKPTIRGNTAPADGDVQASEVHLYFDPTNGAAIPKWKGKSADGTVVSGSLGGGSVTPATDPGDIADPTLATPESNALKINALFANMRTAGLLA